MDVPKYTRNGIKCCAIILILSKWSAINNLSCVVTMQMKIWYVKPGTCFYYMSTLQRFLSFLFCKELFKINYNND